MEKILVVEDEASIADNLHYALTTDGYKVTCVSTAAEGLAALQREDYTLAVFDVGLPDKNGFELCKDVRKFSQIPILFLTARSSEVDRVVGLEIGADDYLGKPFSPRELCARIKAILRRSGLSNDATRDHSAKQIQPQLPFVIDKERHRITYFGTALELSRYEFKILEILISRPGWVFSRERLMNLVWEVPEMSMERTVDTHIKTIRAELRKIKSEIEAIETHRGVGYSLKEQW